MTPLLPSSSSHWIEPAGSGVAQPVQRLELVTEDGGASYHLAAGEPPDLVLANVDGSGVYQPVAPAAAIGKPTIRMMQLAGASVISY